MIHARPQKDVNGEIEILHLSITKDSLPGFTYLLNSALNTWLDAPAELKELADMLIHNKILQEYK